MKNLIFTTIIFLLFGCSKEENEGLSPENIIGKWHSYEFIIDGKIEKGNFYNELSYIEFKKDMTAEEYVFDTYTTIPATYTINGNIITLSNGKQSKTLEVVEFSGNQASIKIADETGKTYLMKIKKTTMAKTPFLDPVTTFGANREEIKATEKRAFAGEENGILYFHPVNTLEQFTAYAFNITEMEEALTFLYRETEPTKLLEQTTELIAFLSTKYSYYGISGKFYIWNKNDLTVGMTLEGNALVIVHQRSQFPVLKSGELKIDVSNFEKTIKRFKNIPELTQNMKLFSKDHIILN